MLGVFLDPKMMEASIREPLYSWPMTCAEMIALPMCMVACRNLQANFGALSPSSTVEFRVARSVIRVF